MPFSFDRVRRCVQERGLEKALDATLAEHESHVGSGNPRKRSTAIACLVKDIENTVGTSQTAQIFEKCGEHCIGETILRKARQFYEGSSSIEEFIGKLNEHHIGGGHLRFEEDKVHVVYTKCYCGAVRHCDEPVPLSYCSCSAGWLKALFRHSLGQEVTVETVDSIIHGASECSFEVTIPMGVAPGLPSDRETPGE